MSSEKHYHYLVSYNFKSIDDSFGFGDMKITTEVKLSNNHVGLLRDRVFEVAKENDEKIHSTVISSIFLLECDCEDERKKEIDEKFHEFVSTQ